MCKELILNCHGDGGVSVLQRDSKRVHFNMYVVIVLTIVLGVVFYRGFDKFNWLVALFFTALSIFLKESVVNVDERSDMSLGITVILPMIYLCGATPAMLISASKGIYDGLRYKKSWQRTMFNSAQFALSTLLAGITIEYLTSLWGETGIGGVLAMSVATIVYMFFNKGLVARIGAVRRGIPWRTEMAARLGTGFYSHVTSGFIGILFTFFIMSYGYWGMIVFSALVVNLSTLLKAAADVHVERGQRKKLQEELVIDEMTGAYNFRYLNNWLNDPSQTELALLFMDIDDFAIFNNTYGHAEGDKVLRLLVEKIKESIRSEDQVIRYGGDEFVVFLHGMDAEGARQVADRIMDNLATVSNPRWKEPLTVSLGIAAMPQHARDKRQLLLFADQAMYQAKEFGKNNAKMWNIAKDPA